MRTLSINLNLLKFKGAGVISLKGKSGVSKRCLVIPVDDNGLFEGENGVYCNLVAFEANLSDGKTHLVKPSIKKEVLENMTEEQRNAIPVLGDIKPFGTVSPEVSNPEGFLVDSNEGSDDLPF